MMDNVLVGHLEADYWALDVTVVVGSIVEVDIDHLLVEDMTGWQSLQRTGAVGWAFVMEGSLAVEARQRQEGTAAGVVEESSARMGRIDDCR